MCVFVEASVYDLVDRKIVICFGRISGEPKGFERDSLLYFGHDIIRVADELA